MQIMCQSCRGLVPRYLIITSASVMSGVHSGVQTLITEMVSFPVPFVHCGCHNLNLVINDAVNSVVDNWNFFDVLGEFFSFFGQSLNKWWEELIVQAAEVLLYLRNYAKLDGLRELMLFVL